MAYLQKKWQYLSFGMFLIMIFYFIAGIAGMVHLDLSVLPPSSIVSSSMNVLGIVICMIIYSSSLHEAKNPSLGTLYFHVLSYMTSAYLFFDEMTWLLDGRLDYLVGLHISEFISYITPICMIIFFWGYVQFSLGVEIKKKHIENYILVGLMIIGFALVLFNSKYHYYYTIDELGYYHREKYFFLSTVIFMMLFLLIALFVYRKKADPTIKRKLITYITLPLVFTIVTNVTFGLSLVNISVLASVLLLYTNVYKERGIDIVYKNNELKRLDQEINEYQTAMMISQIRPHFLYNTLSTIGMLIDMNPNIAKQATNKFSKYLRSNLDSVSNKKPVPLKQELDYVDNYIYLEKLRYEDLEIEVHIQNDDFYIPALTIQPIVENAIKHGIRGKEEGGKVVIRETEMKYNHIITIEDDGIGFDPDQPKNDGRSHVGIENVRQRLQSMVDGKIEISSRIGFGTKVTIAIPKKKK